MSVDTACTFDRYFTGGQEDVHYTNTAGSGLTENKQRAVLIDVNFKSQIIQVGSITRIAKAKESATILSATDVNV